MNPELSKQYVEEQIANLLSFRSIIEHHGWQIEPEGLDVYVSMYPKKHPEMKFLVRLRCDDYPQRAPSLQFIDPISRQEGAQYWPQVGPFHAAISRSQTRPQLCILGVREFHEGCHATDTSHPWNPDKFPFIGIIECTQTLLDKHLP